MTIWAIAFIASTGLAAAGFVVVAVLWLKKLRESLGVALGESVHQNVKTSQRLSEALAQLQRQQQNSDRRLQTVIENNIKLRQEVNQLSDRLASAEREHPPTTPHRLLH